MKIVLILSLLLGLNAYATITPKNIFGTDERTKVLNLFDPPYNAIGQIGNFCTGSLIAPNIVITAAHCIVDIYDNWFYFTISADPTTKYHWENIIIPAAYNKSKDPAYDFAFIFLTTSIEDNHPLFDLKGRFDQIKPITISGYPQDKTNEMWKSSGFASSENNRLYYPCDTKGGMSGAPIFQKTDNSYKLIGIHTRGELESNTGVIIRDEIKEYLSMGKEAIESDKTFKEINRINNAYLEQDPNDFSKVEFINNCREKIIITTLTEDIYGNLKKGLRLISPRKSKLASKSYSDTIYFTMRTQSGSYRLYGKEKCGHGAAWPYCFVSKKVDLTLEKNSIKIDCK